VHRFAAVGAAQVDVADLTARVVAVEDRRACLLFSGEWIDRIIGLESEGVNEWRTP
jgi:hypothetical protein